MGNEQSSQSPPEQPPAAPAPAPPPAPSPAPPPAAPAPESATLTEPAPAPSPVRAARARKPSPQRPAAAAAAAPDSATKTEPAPAAPGRKTKPPEEKRAMGKPKTEGDDGDSNYLDDEQFCADEQFMSLMDPTNYDPHVFDVFAMEKPLYMVTDSKGKIVPVMPLMQHFVCPFCYYRDCILIPGTQKHMYEATRSYSYSSLAQPKHHKGFPSDKSEGATCMPGCLRERCEWLEEMYAAGKAGMVPPSFAENMYRKSKGGVFDGERVLSEDAWKEYKSLQTSKQQPANVANLPRDDMAEIVRQYCAENNMEMKPMGEDEDDEDEQSDSEDERWKVTMKPRKELHRITRSRSAAGANNTQVDVDRDGAIVDPGDVRGKSKQRRAAAKGTITTAKQAAGKGKRPGAERKGSDKRRKVPPSSKSAPVAGTGTLTVTLGGKKYTTLPYEAKEAEEEEETTAESVDPSDTPAKDGDKSEE